MNPPKMQLHHDDYTVAWVSALPVEMAAAEVMLDERHPDLPTKQNDNNTYILGRIHGHNVVIACLPSGVYGTTSAANLATQIQFTFPSIQFGLMVGIGGGVPGAEADIQLGDVVVSKPTRDFGGVIQCDFGKLVSSGQLVRTGMLNKPPAVLLTAISRLQAAHMLRGNMVSSLVSYILETDPMLRGTFGRPDEHENYLSEHLYHEFLQNEEACESSVDGTSGSKRSCKIHYGLIASGNQVIKNARVRDQLARQYGILCFEMEAAGLMDNFPCLVIRGISDYADSSKNKSWQGYASLTAAAYSKELLSVVPESQISPETKQASTKEYGLTLNNKNFLDKMYSYTTWALSQDFRVEDTLLSRITKYDHEKIHQRLSRKRIIGTTQWFLDHENFHTWNSEKGSPYLWCSGKIGSGKTIIATTVVEESRPRALKQNSAIVFFYLDEQHDTDQTHLLLSSFIKQLCGFLMQMSTPFPKKVQTMLQTYFGPEKQSPDLEALQDIFTSLFILVPNSIYILDGLDTLESAPIKSLLIFFRSLFRDPCGSKLLFFSRDQLAGNLSIASFFPGVTCISTSLNVTHDIRAYIKETLAEKMIYRRLTEDDQILQEMESVLLDESSEMFLWVYLQIEILWDTCVTDAEIRRALASLPKDLEETYRRCMNRINLQDRRIMLSLTWANFAVRPLHIDEIREAVAFTVEDTAWHKDKVPRSDFLLSSCANLLILDPTDNRIRFAHSSVRQFLRRSQSSIPELREAFQDGDRDCGQLCISYLSFSDFSLQLDKPIDYTVQLTAPNASLLAVTLTGSQLVRRLFPKARFPQASVTLPIRSIRPYSIRSREQYKFLNYATENWARHTKNLKTSDFLWEKFARLALTINESWKIHPWYSGGRSQLSHTHALFGWAVKEHHMPLLRLVMGLESAIDQISNLPLLEEKIPALHLASKMGYDEVVEIILPACDVNKLDIDGLAPLHHAVLKGHLHVAQRLLNSNGIEPNVRSKDLETPLWLASYQGWEDIVVRLIDQGADIELGNLEGRVPLMAASAAGHMAIVDHLIQRGANISARDINDDSAMRFAIHKRRAGVIDIILSSKRPDSDEIAFAIEKSYPEVIASMLHKGLDPDTSFHQSKPNKPGTILAWAAGHGHKSLVQLLIDKGANVNLQDENGWTALTLASGKGRSEIAELLIRHGALVNYSREDMVTPLQSAAAHGHVDIIELLLANGADIHQKGLVGRAVLGDAAGGLEFLISRGTFLEDRDDKGRTPLIRAAENGRLVTTKVLLAHGANSKATDDSGRTALIAATRKGHLKVAQLLTGPSPMSVSQSIQS